MSEHEEEQPKRSFKVEDRRRFAAAGQEQLVQPDDTPAAPAPDANRTAAAASGSGAAAETEHSRAVEMNFATFIIGLSTQALAHLGEIEDPTQGQRHIDLVAARQLIDILGILQTKTKGNLDEGESNLLEHCLYDLRMKYVEVVRHQQRPPGSA